MISDRGLLGARLPVLTGGWIDGAAVRQAFLTPHASRGPPRASPEPAPRRGMAWMRLRCKPVPSPTAPASSAPERPGDH